jgi:hypothetical protein
MIGDDRSFLATPSKTSADAHIQDPGDTFTSKAIETLHRAATTRTSGDVCENIAGNIPPSNWMEMVWDLLESLWAYEPNDRISGVTTASRKPLPPPCFHT